MDKLQIAKEFLELLHLDTEQIRTLSHFLEDLYSEVDDEENDSEEDELNEEEDY